MSLEKDAKKIQEKIGFTESKKIYQADCAQKKQ